MFSRDDLGNLNNSLPPWISDHLGENSYMADEVQLPYSPRENPPSPEASPSGTTPPTIEREINIMTKNELDFLIESHSFPPSIQVRLPEEGEVGEKPARRISQQRQRMEEPARRISLKKLAQKVGELKGESSAMKSTSVKGVDKGAMSPMATQKKATWKFIEQPSKEVASKVATREDAFANLVVALGPKVTMLRSSATEKKILEAVIPSYDKVEMDKLELDKMVSKLFHILGEMTRAQNSIAKLDRHMAKLKVREEQVAEELAMAMARAGQEAIKRPSLRSWLSWRWWWLIQEVEKLAPKSWPLRSSNPRTSSRMLLKRQPPGISAKGSIFANISFVSIIPTLAYTSKSWALTKTCLREEEDEMEKEEGMKKEKKKKNGEEKGNTNPFSHTCKYL
ncbi:hypothetical protein Acr_00g0056790 [Actinidia rufa]|uniref:Uncharacterized protein n=1 Tax=Actinidia rufa TaxID=165716 RepID=A0A7J0DMB8_9ERIC|nr:hypothetical protein Acr_00g0056790 [Actinidia rufa]